MTNEEMMGMLATKNPCANGPPMVFDPANPNLLAQGEQATLDVIGGVPPYTWEILQTSIFNFDAAHIVFPAGYSDTYIKATSTLGVGGYPYLAADPALARHGSADGTSWYANTGQVIEQRWNIDLGASVVLKQLLIENGHQSGGNRDRGIKNFAIQGSNNALALPQVDYSSEQYWTDIATGLQARQHIVPNYDDPQLFDIDNDTAYRYYSLKIADNWGNGSYLNLRHAQFHTADDKVYKFITDTPQITITAPNYALWSCRVKCTDLCGTIDNAFLFTSPGKWALQESHTMAGSPTTCGDVDFRLIKNGCMFEGEYCNTNHIGQTGPHYLDCTAYGGGLYDITVKGACSGGVDCTHAKNLNYYCWPFP